MKKMKILMTMYIVLQKSINKFIIINIYIYKYLTKCKQKPPIRHKTPLVDLFIINKIIYFYLISRKMYISKVNNNIHQLYICVL